MLVAALLQLVGVVCMAGGGAWSVIALGNGRAATPGNEAYALLGSLLVAWPGLALLGFGLTVWALGIVIGHLSRISRNTADTADAVETLVKLAKEPA